ncbi:MAG: hypothetical protein IJW19_06420, partial [Clostridia bacterium]|nr:hypothetical protein [Clostridia bacterium]
DNQVNEQADAPANNQVNEQADAPANNQVNEQADAPTGEQAQGQTPTQQPPVNPYCRPANPYQNPNPYQRPNPYQNPNPYQGHNPYQNQNPYQRPIWEAPKQEEKPKGTGFNVASLILGILSILCCCVYGFVSIIMGILAIVFYAISKKKGTSNGMAVAGMICAIFGLLLGILYFIYAVLAFVGVFGAIDAFGSSYLEL